MPDVRFLTIAACSTLIASLDRDVRTRQLETSLNSFRSWLLISMHGCKTIVYTYRGGDESIAIHASHASIFVLH